MNVQPSPAIAGAAGTARAQTRGSDTETIRSQQAAVNQHDAPGQSEDADQLTLEPSGKSGDRDADGRRQFEPDQGISETIDEDSATVIRKSTDDGCGEHLDLEA